MEAIFRSLFVWVIFLLQRGFSLFLVLLSSLFRISKSLFIKVWKSLNDFVKNCKKNFKYIKYLYLFLSKFIFNFLKSDLDEKVISKQRSSKYSSETTQLLNKWYESNVETPFASNSSLNDLIASTKLTRKQVLVWLAHKRFTNDKKSQQTKYNIRNETTLKLNNYFDNVTKYPNDHEYTELSKNFGLNKQQLVNWFKKKRYFSKQKIVKID